MQTAQSKKNTEPIYFVDAASFRAWLKKNYETEKELILAFLRIGTGKKSTYPEALDEALCYGWIDGVRKSLAEGV